MSQVSRREVLAAAAAGAALAGFPALADDAAPDSLNALAAAKGLRFGSCMGTGPSGAPRPAGVSGQRANQFDDPELRAIFVRECGILVPENELKWYALRPSATEFDFERADKLMAFAANNALLVRGHTLLWNRDEWMPAWVRTYDFGTRPGTEAERLLTGHITTVCKRYPQIFSWDVVNETINPDTGGMTESVFTKYIGPEVIDIAFHAARAAVPKAQLVYNDYMSWGPGNAKHRDGVIALLERLKKNGVPVEALGVQAHIGPGASATTPTLTADGETEWRKFLDAATGLGLDLVITEFDEGDQNLPADIALRDRAVADLARRYLDVMLSYSQLRYVMAWGLVDKYSWLRDRWPRADGLPKRPSLYDDDYRAKPIRAAVADAFRVAPARNWLA
ncbi:MAG TPA: endo-1,4-beta-xylanase [Rhizomicrobium sp.]